MRELKQDEYLKDGLIYCVDCNTARIFEYEGKMIKCLCECKTKERDEADKKKQIDLQATFMRERLVKLGINYDKYGLEKFKVKYDFQRAMVNSANEFLKNAKKGIVIVGNTGTGKTFLLSGLLIRFLKKGYNVNYLKWLQHGKDLKALSNSPEYKYSLDRFKKAEILYIDDFLKVGRNGAPTDADLSLAFDILDYRVDHNLSTMISTERSIEEILNFDEAVGGRLLEACKIKVNVNRFSDMVNIRVRGMGE